MLFLKHEPKTAAEMANPRQVLAITGWLKGWKQGKALLLYGPPGSGESLSAKLAAKHLGWELVVSNASESRSAASVREFLMNSSRQKSMFYKGKLLVVDDAEALDSSAAVAELVRESMHPVIIIAGDAYEPKLRALRQQCTLVKFEKLPVRDIESFLKRVCAAERIIADARKTAEACNGDMRAALIDLEAGPGARDTEENVFQSVRNIFKSSSMDQARNAAMQSSEVIVPWLEENIPNEYRHPEEIASAYGYLAKADIFSRRVSRRQSWSMQKFSYDLAVSGVALSKKKPYPGFSRYSPPKFHPNNGVLQKLAGALGVPARSAREYIPILVGTGSIETIGLEKPDVERLKLMAK